MNSKLQLMLLLFFTVFGVTGQSLLDSTLIEDYISGKKRILKYTNGDGSVIKIGPSDYADVIAEYEAKIAKRDQEIARQRREIVFLKEELRKAREGRQEDKAEIEKRVQAAEQEKRRADSLQLINEALVIELKKERALRMDVERQLLCYTDTITTYRDQIDSLSRIAGNYSIEISRLQKEVERMIANKDAFAKAFDQTIVHYRKGPIVLGKKRVSLFDRLVKHNITDVRRSGEIVIEQSLIREESLGPSVEVIFDISEKHSHQLLEEFNFTLYENIEQGQNGTNIHVYSGEYAIYLKRHNNKRPFVQLEEGVEYVLRIRVKTDELETLFKEGFIFQGS